MLLAKINGKFVAESQNSEDYLTSTILGRLRYVRPKMFWMQTIRANFKPVQTATDTK